MLHSQLTELSPVPDLDRPLNVVYSASQEVVKATQRTKSSSRRPETPDYNNVRINLPDGYELDPMRLRDHSIPGALRTRDLEKRGIFLNKAVIKPTIYVPPKKKEPHEAIGTRAIEDGDASFDRPFTQPDPRLGKKPRWYESARNPARDGAQGGDKEKPSQPNMKIEIPPFLSWAANAEIECYWYEDSPETSEESIERILEAVHDTLLEQRNFRWQKLYRRALSLTKVDIERAHGPIQTSASDKPASTVHTETNDAGCEPLKHSDHDSTNAPKDVQHQDESHLLEACQANCKNLCAMMFELLSFYFPLSATHSLAEKCWGALHAVLAVCCSRSQSFSHIQSLTATDRVFATGSRQKKNIPKTSVPNTGSYETDQSLQKNQANSRHHAYGSIVTFVSPGQPTDREMKLCSIFGTFIFVHGGTQASERFQMMCSRPGCKTTYSTENVSV